MATEDDAPDHALPRCARLRCKHRTLAGHHRLPRAPRSTGFDETSRTGDDRISDHRCSTLADPRGHRRSHQCRGDHPLRRRTGVRRLPGHTSLRRSALSTQRSGVDGNGVRPSLDADRSLAGLAEPPTRQRVHCGRGDSARTQRSRSRRVRCARSCRTGSGHRGRWADHSRARCVR